jgi:predicted O-methyltransferase YrrM
MRRALLLLAAMTAVGAVGFAVFWVEIAVALLAASWLCGFAWVVLWARTTSGKINQVLTRTNRAAGELERTAKHQQAIRRRVRGIAEKQRAGDRLQQRTADQVRLTRKELYSVLVWVQRTPSVTHELGRVYDRLVDHDRPMPELGDWAMSPSTLVWILDRMSDSSVRTILECGSGSSTVWFATALAHRGGEGKVIALEASAEYAEITRADLDRHGLQDRAVVLHAPLVETAVPERANQPWFDLSVLPDLPPVDLLFVDGPIGGIARQARYPAFPLLADRLAPGAAVVLDDTRRPDEAAIVRLWKNESFYGRRLREVRRLDRATAFVSEDA